MIIWGNPSNCPWNHERILQLPLAIILIYSYSTTFVLSCCLSCAVLYYDWDLASSLSIYLSIYLSIHPPMLLFRHQHHHYQTPSNSPRREADKLDLTNFAVHLRCGFFFLFGDDSKPANAILQTLSHTRKLFVLQVCDFIILNKIEIVDNQWVSLPVGLKNQA